MRLSQPVNKQTYALFQSRSFVKLMRSFKMGIVPPMCSLRPAVLFVQRARSEHGGISWLQISEHERRPSQLEALNEMPLYPTEAIIWDENIVPMEFFTGEGCLALPKLNLQFLTLHDYLLRNFNLFRLESTCEYI